MTEQAPPASPLEGLTSNLYGALNVRSKSHKAADDANGSSFGAAVSARTQKGLLFGARASCCSFYAFARAFWPLPIYWRRDASHALIITQQENFGGLQFLYERLLF